MRRRYSSCCQAALWSGKDASVFVGFRTAKSPLQQLAFPSGESTIDVVAKVFRFLVDSCVCELRPRLSHGIPLYPV